MCSDRQGWGKVQNEGQKRMSCGARWRDWCLTRKGGEEMHNVIIVVAGLHFVFIVCIFFFCAAIKKYLRTTLVPAGTWYWYQV